MLSVEKKESFSGKTERFIERSFVYSLIAMFGSVFLFLFAKILSFLGSFLGWMPLKQFFGDDFSLAKIFIILYIASVIICAISMVIIILLNKEEPEKEGVG